MVRPDSMDGEKAVNRWDDYQAAGKPWCKRSLKHVKGCLEETGVYDEDKLRFVVGPVEKTLLDPANLPERIAVLRLDTDWYASTKAELKHLYPRLSSGGTLIVDDYGHWYGCRQAVNEYFPGVQLTPIDYTAVSLVKP
jgi:hypothetical protein